MKKSNKPETADLLQKAEELLKKRSSKATSVYSEVEILQLIHELEVHQIELELQNEELRRAKNGAAEFANEKYIELYDFAPTAYFTLSKEGKIIDLNLNAAIMLGKERLHLKNRKFDSFVSPDTKPIFALFLQKIFKSKEKESCGVNLSVEGSRTESYVYINGQIHDCADQCHLTVVDITDHKKAEELIAQQNTALFNLNNFAIGLSNLSSDDDIEAFIAKQIKKIAYADVALFSEYDPEKRITKPKYIEMDQLLLNKVVRLLGDNIQNVHSVVTDEIYRMMTTEIVGIRKTLYEASFGAISLSMGKAIQTLLGVDRFIGLAYVINGKLFGTSLLAMSKGRPDPSKIILENFIHLAAASLQRKKTENALRESERFLRETQTMANLGTYKLDFVSLKWSGSKILDKILGIDPDFDRSLKGWVSIIHPDWEKIMTDYFIQGLKINKTKIDREFKIIRPNDKEERWVHGIGHFTFDDDNQPKTMVGTIQDITERKQAESELKRKMGDLTVLNKELEKFAYANQELEQFAYIASHNLQQPLRTISNYVQIFEEDYFEQINDEGKKCLRVINDATKRMIMQLDSLLDFSRLGRNLKLTIVDCKKIIDDVISDLETIVITSKASIEIKEMPILNVYESEFSQLFQNLIVNAIKFRKEGTQPEILINSEYLDEKWRFSISDNGIGIARKNSEKIFNIFQRLHTDVQYQGCGIGLAFCKKIVQLHKGEIWVESSPGQGTTFYFTIANLTE